VLATVTAGLYISWNGLRLISAPTRLQGIFFWDFLIYVVEGLVFLLTGLQARTLIAGIKNYSVTELATSAAVVSIVVILTRFIWIYPATYLPRWLVPSIARSDPAPPWQWPFILAFTGVRGIVSLAAALAIPLTTAAGEPFPNRDLVLILTFVVVLVTLVGQGLTMPWVVRALGLANAGRRERVAERVEEFRIRQQAIETALERLEALQAAGVPEAIVARLRAQHRERLKQVRNRSAEDDEQKERVLLGDKIELQLISAERDVINESYRRGELKDEARRRIERELDLREAHLASVRNEDFLED
jgi:CPA1 family monovalent cation:H+ antiporter